MEVRKVRSEMMLYVSRTKQNVHGHHAGSVFMLWFVVLIIKASVIFLMDKYCSRSTTLASVHLIECVSLLLICRAITLLKGPLFCAFFQSSFCFTNIQSTTITGNCIDYPIYLVISQFNLHMHQLLPKCGYALELL